MFISLLSSAIKDSNQDIFIQKAINASNAYSSIIEAMKQAEKAAKDASMVAGEALKVKGLAWCNATFIYEALMHFWGVLYLVYST